MNPEPDDAIRAADRLQQSVEGLRGELQNQRAFGRRNRHLIRGLTISLIFDVLLSVVVAVLAVKSAQTAQQANQNRDLQVVTCKAGNDARAAQIQLWNYVLDLASQNPQPDPQQAQRIAQFKTYLATVFAPRDCAATALPPAPSAPPTTTSR